MTAKVTESSMPPARQSIARSCLDAADSGTMTFPEILRTLAAAGFESYSIDFRRDEAVYYATDGESVAFPIRRTHGMVSTTFDGQALQAAISSVLVRSRPPVSIRSWNVS